MSNLLLIKFCHFHTALSHDITVTHTYVLKKSNSGHIDVPFGNLVGVELFSQVNGLHERVGISPLEVYKRVGKSVIWVCKRAQKG